MIEQKMTGLWKGQITVQTQGGQAALLLERLVKLVKEEEQRIGMTSSKKEPRSAGIIGRMEAREAADKMDAAGALRFAQAPVPKPEYFVSYAWGDTTPGGRDRERVVDHICAAAEERGITILRDKKVLGLGERISKFMQRLGQSDRVFVILSDKYLKSHYCMYELFEIWRNCRQNEQEFLSHIRVFALPDAKIWSPLERARVAAHWREESGQLETLVNAHGFDLLSEKDYRHYKLMKDFSSHIGDILTTVADIVQPSTFEDLEKYGFDQPMEPKHSKDDGNE